MVVVLLMMMVAAVTQLTDVSLGASEAVIRGMEGVRVVVLTPSPCHLGD